VTSMTMQRTQFKAPSQSRGAALIVALILLLVMTILGITALNSSTLQGFMSSAYQQQTSTLTGVENVLLEAEMDIEDIVTNGVNGRAHFINLLDGSTEFPAATGTPDDWSTTGAAVTEAMGEFEFPSRFVLEYMGEFEVPGESIAVGGGLADSRIHVFRVSARGVEQQRGSARVVQSYYVTLRSPFGE